MDYKSIVGDVKEGLVVDVESLYAKLSQLQDRRHSRGKRYSLVTILLYTILAELAGEDRLSGISEWVCHRQQELAEALGLENSPTVRLVNPSVAALNLFTRAAGRAWV